MTVKIEKELCDLLETQPKRGEDRQDFLLRILKAIDKLSDKDFDSLSSDAKAWFNKSCDAAEQKEDLPEFEVEEKTTRRKSSDKAESSEPSVGDAVVAVTKRGKKVEGKLVEIDKEVVVIKTADGEEEFARERLESLNLADGGDADDEQPDPIKVGVVVVLTTKRGKKVEGKITELDEEVVVIKTADGEEEFARDRVESIEPAGGAKSKAADKEEAPTSRRGSTKDDKPATKASGTKAPSATQLIRDLIIGHLKDKEAIISSEALNKAVEKAGIEAKKSTVDLVLSETTRIIEMLGDAGLLKVDLGK